MLAGVLTQEDEDAVLAELEAITQVGVTLHCKPLLLLKIFPKHACSFAVIAPLHLIVTPTKAPSVNAAFNCWPLSAST